MWNTKACRVQVKLNLICESSSVCNNWQLCCLRIPGLPRGIYCQLTKEQASIYQNIVNEVEESLRIIEDKDKATVFVSSLLRLKQVCNHPTQALQDGSLFLPDRSFKLQCLLQMCNEIVNNGESLLIFSQFTETCQQLERLLRTQHGYQTYYLHGGTPQYQREKMIQNFQADDAQASVFILSVKAGGVGITLTKANHVIHFDRWWNPAVENQATDRVYRIDQKKTVFAYKFITLGTIEEQIDYMLEDKQQISQKVIGSGESWLGQLDRKSFIQLIQLKNEMVADI